MLLGELLIQKGLLTAKDLEGALEEQKGSGDFLGRILVRRGAIKEKDLLKVLGEQFHMPCVSLKDQYVNWEVAMRFSSSLVVDRQCLPIREDETGITVAITNPLDAEALGEVERQARNVSVRPVLVSMSEMREAIKDFERRVAEKIKRLLD